MNADDKGNSRHKSDETFSELVKAHAVVKRAQGELFKPRMVKLMHAEISGGAFCMFQILYCEGIAVQWKRLDQPVFISLNCR
jgi:hypothetical protein